MSKTYTTSNTAVDQLAALLARLPSEAHFRVHRAYDITVPPEWQFPHRRNEDLHVVFVRGGTGSYLLDRVHEPLARGKLIFVSNGFPHSGHQARADPPRILPIRFGLYDNRAGRAMVSSRPPFAVAVRVRRVLAIESLFEAHFAHYARGLTALRQGLCGALIHVILAELLLALREGERETDRRLARVREFITNNPADRTPLAGLARMAQLSPKYFSRLFRSQVGLTPATFRVRVRCRHARYLLENTTRSIKDVAHALNYPDPYAFSKQFKQVVGQPPSAFRG